MRFFLHVPDPKMVPEQPAYGGRAVTATRHPAAGSDIRATAPSVVAVVAITAAAPAMLDDQREKVTRRDQGLHDEGVTCKGINRCVTMRA